MPDGLEVEYACFRCTNVPPSTGLVSYVISIAEVSVEEKHGDSADEGE